MQFFKNIILIIFFFIETDDCVAARRCTKLVNLLYSLFISNYISLYLICDVQEPYVYIFKVCHQILPGYTAT